MAAHQFLSFKKHALVIVLLSFISTGSFAQFGIQVGWNTSGYKFTKSGVTEKRGWNWGVNAGVMYRLGGKLLCIQPTVLYTQKGATNNNDGPNYVSGILEFKNKLNYAELSLPVIFKVPLGVPKVSFDFGVGPYFGKLVSAVSKAKDLDGNTKKTNFKIGNASTDDFKPGDIGLSIYMGCRIKHFNMCMGYDLGISNITPTTNETIKNGCFSINMGAFF